MSVEIGRNGSMSCYCPIFGLTDASTSIRAAFSVAKLGEGISSLGAMSPNLVMIYFISVMAGALGTHRLLVAFIIQWSVDAPQNGLSKHSLWVGFAHLDAGLCCGLSGLAARMAIGVAGFGNKRNYILVWFLFSFLQKFLVCMLKHAQAISKNSIEPNPDTHALAPMSFISVHFSASWS